MTEAEQLKNEFEKFKLETDSKFKSFPLLDKKNFQKYLKETLEEVARDKDKIRLLIDLKIIALVSSTATVFLLISIIYLILFTEPI